MNEGENDREQGRGGGKRGKRGGGKRGRRGGKNVKRKQEV
jgi:hypothetical protein